MSTATAIKPEAPATKTPAQAAYSGERRSHSAKMGWVFRRVNPDYKPDAETLARERLERVIADADPGTARLYACRIAELVVHHFTAQYPGDGGCTTAIAAARRVAQGRMTDRARGRASMVARLMVDQAMEDAGCYRRQYSCAANAAAWATERNVRKGSYWSLIWATSARVDEIDTRTYEERTALEAAMLNTYCDELEAIKATK